MDHFLPSSPTSRYVPVTRTVYNYDLFRITISISLNDSEAVSSATFSSSNTTGIVTSRKPLNVS